MRVTTVLGMALCSTMWLGGCAGEAPVSEDVAALDTQDGRGKPEPPMLGAHQSRDAHTAGHGGGGNPNMTLHGGNVLAAVTIQPIFWGPSWASATFTADKKTGLDQFYAGYIGSTYANTNIEYDGADGQYVTASNINYLGGDVTDLSATPRSAPSTSTVLAEVCKNITSPVEGGYYPVYTDIARGHASYCAWHSWGQCGTTNVQFGFFFKLDGDAGCDPQDPGTTRSQGLEALANVSGHELSETVTDPRGTGWLDASGSENGDKCAWVFSQPVSLADGSTWKIQGNWSNAAYTAGTGYANSSGQKGCLYNN